MAPRRQVTIGASSKCIAIKTDEDTVPSPTVNQPCIEDSGSSSQQEPINSVQSTQQCEDQLLQSLYEMKAQIKKQQVQSDHERERMALNRENIL